MADSQAALVDYLDVMLLAKAVLVVAWQVTGWWVVVSCLRQGRVSTLASAGVARPLRSPPRAGDGAPGGDSRSGEHDRRDDEDRQRPTSGPSPREHVRPPT
jgi:hypothetical protein